ncbi:hypothetical protein [Staphylococcus argensis]|uniref:Uncharacterized protein n=1 Tax=Staphylococcus argensis TaxID=1607738 RepID=A0A2K4FDY2_9STAP|nr:hypothetical protein [Staphylococcus argensis]MCY6990984.1 hypothetical protein [Staphylococcus argensis]POA09511.1 hypothetical protein CD039_01815 [Staphylococcus argensis]
MATKSFTTEYQFTSKSVASLIKTIEMQEKSNHSICKPNNKKIAIVKDSNRIIEIIESYK